MKFFFHFFEFMLWTAPSIVIAGFTFATTLYPYLFIANCLWFLAHLLYGYINRMARSIYKQRFESVRRAYQNRRTPSLRRRRQGLLTLVFVLSIFGSCLRIFEAMRPSHEVCLTARPEDETTTQLLVICIPRKDCFWVMQFCSSIVETGKIARHPTPEEVEHIRSHIRFEQEFWHVWEQLVVISWLANRTVPEEQAPLERHCLHLFYPDVYVQDISPDSLYPPTKWP
jgi:hypothetical protein